MSSQSISSGSPSIKDLTSLASQRYQELFSNLSELKNDLRGLSNVVRELINELDEDCKLEHLFVISGVTETLMSENSQCVSDCEENLLQNTLSKFQRLSDTVPLLIEFTDMLAATLNRIVGDESYLETLTPQLKMEICTFIYCELTEQVTKVAKSNYLAIDQSIDPLIKTSNNYSPFVGANASELLKCLEILKNLGQKKPKVSIEIPTQSKIRCHTEQNARNKRVFAQTPATRFSKRIKRLDCTS